MNDILIYILIGFFAQMIDGAFGMAYGVITTSLLLFLFPENISPALASAVMHFSEIFNTGYASYVYKKNKLINHKMFRAMFIPAILGAISGALCISIFSKHFGEVVKPFIALYFIVVSIIIGFRAFNLFEHRKRFFSIPMLALFGAFMDSIGGGGWGALVTSALIAGGRDMRSTIGTSHAIKFVVVLMSSVTFLSVLGWQYLWIALWVSSGSIIAVPVSIYLNNKLPKKLGLLSISIVLFLIALKTLIKYI
ncbi:MAG: sulfite exporter TauE/SafE family protein [Bacteroidota bacterium]